VHAAQLKDLTTALHYIPLHAHTRGFGFPVEKNVDLDATHLKPVLSEHAFVHFPGCSAVSLCSIPHHSHNSHSDWLCNHCHNARSNSLEEPQRCDLPITRLASHCNTIPNRLRTSKIPLFGTHLFYYRKPGIAHRTGWHSIVGGHRASLGDIKLWKVHRYLIINHSFQSRSKHLPHSFLQDYTSP
jgi:hypothetical protein